MLAARTHSTRNLSKIRSRSGSGRLSPLPRQIPAQEAIPEATTPWRSRRFDNSATLREDAIVVETDCPYLSPQTHRGRRNEPAYIAETASRIAELRGAPLAAFAAQSTANAVRLFRV